MFYKLNYSSDPKVTGNCDSQTERSVMAIDKQYPNSYKNYIVKKATDPDSVITATPILVKRAILTDLINGSALGGGIQKMISNKLKEILASQKHPGLQFFPMSILYHGVELKNYWLTSPFEFDMEAINYNKSSIQINTWGNTKVRDIAISDVSHFIKAEEAFVPPEGIYIQKLVLNYELPQNLLLLRRVPGGIGYFVSEALKYQIEDAGCTGMAFEPVPQSSS